jgi:hypothetical protein
MTDSQNFPDNSTYTPDSQDSSDSFIGTSDGQNFSDTYTDITETSWAQRLGGSVVGVFFGLIFLIGAPCLLWWNEGNEVKALQGLSSAAHSVVSVSAATIAPSLNGKLVYLTGDLVASAPPRDSLFGVIVAGQARLERHVEMYQWKETSHSETERQFGGGQRTVTTYSYDKVWSETPITSHTFRHPEGHNNPAMPFQTTVFDADLRIGAYSPDRDLIVKLKEFQPIDPVATTVPVGFRQTTLGFYRGVDENSPRIGDLRVLFKGFPLQQVSAVAMQRDAMLVPYFSKTGSRVQFIEAGVVAPETLFADEATKQRILAWAIRAGCLLMIYLGIRLILGPLTLLGAFIPFFEDIADVAAGLAAAAISIVLFCGTIFVSWIVFRPLWAASIALFGAACCYALLRHRAQKRKLTKAVSFLPR